MRLKPKRTDLRVAGEVPAVSNQTAREEIELLREKTIQLVTNNPHKAAIILSSWLHSAQSIRKTKLDKKAA
ncbi:MAG: hypothetical protein ABI041_04735 [Bdellovibrionia bacterium]